MLKASYYVRTSTQRQENEETIKSQIDEIEQKIKEDGNILLPQHKFVDDGWSGTILARPSLDAMRDSAKNKEFDVLYVYDRGRISREFYIQEMILAELEDLDIQFITLHDIQAKTAEEKVMQSSQKIPQPLYSAEIQNQAEDANVFCLKREKLKKTASFT